MSATALAPRKPIKRDDVESRTRLRVRERIAFVRYWLHVHPAWRGAIIATVLVLTVEHNDVTFPVLGAIVSAIGRGLWWVIVALFATFGVQL